MAERTALYFLRIENFFSLPPHSYWQNTQLAAGCAGKPSISQHLLSLMGKKGLRPVCAFTTSIHFVWGAGGEQRCEKPSYLQRPRLHLLISPSVGLLLVQVSSAAVDLKANRTSTLVDSLFCSPHPSRSVVIRYRNSNLF